MIRSHLLTVREQALAIKKEELDLNEKKIILENLAKLYMKQVDSVLDELEKTTGYKYKNNEERERTKQCLIKFEKLTDQGLHIYSTLDSPKETKALFEPIETKYLSVNIKSQSLKEKMKNAEDVE